MRDKSDLNTICFLVSAVFWAGISMLWYKGLLFRGIESLTYRQSGQLLWGMIIVSILAGAFLTCRYYKNDWSIASCLAIPYGLYTILAYKGLIERRVRNILMAAMVVFLLYILLIVCRKIKKKRNVWRVIKIRFYKCIYGGQMIIAAAMMVLVFSLGIPVFFGKPVFRSSVTPQMVEQEQEQTISDHIETVLLLQEELWRELEIEEKLDVLQTVANIEVSYLGIPHELNVIVEDLESPRIGCYDDETHTITLDLNHVQYDPAKEVLDSLAHEAFHGYTHRLVDVYNSSADEYKGLLLFEKAVTYAEEYGNYINNKEDVIAYYTQECEVDSRHYAEQAVDEYYYRIAEYLNDHKYVN